MNKALLLWNLVITILLILMVISGCTALDPQYANLVTEVRNNRAIIDQLINLAEENREEITKNSTAIMKNTITIANLQTTTEAALAAVEISMRQYVEQYVQAYVAQAVK